MGVLRKIVITGPESSGKTSLTEALAAHFGTAWVREMARPYLAARGGFGSVTGYVEEDLLHIARLQLQVEDSTAAAIGAHDPPLVFCDTDLITIRIWGEEKFGRSDPWIIQQTELRPYDLWLLCAPDMPWEPDPLREDPHDRDRLFEVYERTMQRLVKPYAIIRGPHAERMRSALDVIEQRFAAEVRSGD